MAMGRRIEIDSKVVFALGAYVLGPAEAVLDYNASPRSDGSRPQQLDAETGLPLWSVTVLDADPEAGKKDKTVTVKIAAKVQPVPPENTSGTPFCPVEFVDLVAVPWIDDNGQRPRLAWSFRAAGMIKPGEARSTAAGTGKTAA